MLMTWKEIQECALLYQQYEEKMDEIRLIVLKDNPTDEDRERQKTLALQIRDIKNILYA